MPSIAREQRETTPPSCRRDSVGMGTMSRPASRRAPATRGLVSPGASDVFATADRSTTRNYGGTAPGLAIGRQLACVMGGAGTVESEVGRMANRIGLNSGAPPECRTGRCLFAATFMLVLSTGIGVSTAVAQEASVTDGNAMESSERLGDTLASGEKQAIQYHLGSSRMIVSFPGATGGPLPTVDTCRGPRLVPCTPPPVTEGLEAPAVARSEPAPSIPTPPANPLRGIGPIDPLPRSYYERVPQPRPRPGR